MYNLNKEQIKLKKDYYKNYVMANGLGGYTSFGVYNNSFRKHDGYLVGAVEPPEKRFVFLKRTFEKAGDISTDSQEYFAGVADGHINLNSFSYDITPTYNYNLKGVKYSKTLSPIYLKNAVNISYEIEESTAEHLDIYFDFSNRSIGDVDTKESLNITVEKISKNMVEVVTGNGSVYISFSEGEFKYLINNYNEDIYYDYDFRMGDKRLDNSKNLFLLRIKPDQKKNVSVVCSLTKDVSSDARKNIIEYKSLISKDIEKAGYNNPFLNKLVKSSFQFISYRESTENKTILAGLPWFSDWGRDTMIAFDGIVLKTKRYESALSILKSFKEYEKDGLIPNAFLGENNKPLYNSVDAPLWYINAVYKYVLATEDFKGIKELYPMMAQIIKKYSEGTIFNIKMSDKGLISAGSDLDQITWMDVRINGICVTPRHGMPVEINALWYNALMIMSNFADEFGYDPYKYIEIALKVKKNFTMFIKPDGGLYDVVNPFDDSVRPNQLYAYTLPYKVLDFEHAKLSFAVVEKELFSKFGLRSLSKLDPRFISEYSGDIFKRDMSYHMGTSWCYLIGPYIDALCYVNEYKPEAIKKARDILEAFSLMLNNECIDGICEIYDGDCGYRSKGCYSQAWSVAEVLRAYVDNCLQEND